jgi:hypothetical protein
MLRIVCHSTTILLASFCKSHNIFESELLNQQIALLLHRVHAKCSAPAEVQLEVSTLAYDQLFITESDACLYAITGAIPYCRYLQPPVSYVDNDQSSSKAT